jgi:tetratricopeptide (TPR) repeat protein
MSGYPRAASLAPFVVLVAALPGGVVVQTHQAPRVDAVIPAPQAPPPARPDASEFAPDALEKHTADWLMAARAHVAGRFDTPAASVARWPNDLIRVVVDRAAGQLHRERAARRQRRIPGDEDGAAVLAKALLLHTDIAIAENTGMAGAETGAVDALLLDAKPIASRRFSMHWSHARVLADALRRDAAGAPARAGGMSSIAIARAWYRAAGALFQQWADLGHLNSHLVDADDLLADDPVLLLYEGTLHQAYADRRLQSYLMQLRTSVRGLPEGMMPMYQSIDVVGGIRYPFHGAATELASAERALRRALALDDSLVEARIRLAHVLDSRGKPAEAAELARQALGGPLPPFLEYYGAMVLGRAEIRLGRQADARAAFERAAARYPRSQSARVALSHIADSPGEASDGLVQALGPEPEERMEDPWSQYFRLHEPDAHARYEALKTSVP